MQPLPPQSSPVQVPLMQQMEEGIKNLLTGLGTVGLTVQTQVEVLPENKAGIEEALDGARITIAYRQSEFGENARGGGMPFFGGMGGVVAQEETLHADVFVRARGRVNSKGVYAVMEAVRYFLLGKVPFPGARALWFTGQQLDEFETNNAWRYMLSVATSTVLVARLDNDEEALQSVSFAFASIQGSAQPSPIQLPPNHAGE